jgi:hypothetical protein
MALSEIATVLSALQAAKDIAKTAIGLRDSAALQTQLIELNSKIIDAQSSASAALEERLSLIEQIRQLKEEIAGFEGWEAEKQRYELKQIHGSFAYASKPDASGAEPPHYLCANCYHDRKKSFLQPIASGSRNHKCHRCQSTLIW